MKPVKKPLTQNQALSRLFDDYLSRNIDNLEKRISELGWPTSTLEIFEKRGWVKRLKNTSKIHYERVNQGGLTYYCDKSRHLVCRPYSIENLHEMAKRLKINRCWFHKDHYDIPKTRIEEIMAKCIVVSSKEIVSIARHKTP